MSKYFHLILFTFSFLLSYVPPTISGTILDIYDNPIEQVSVTTDIDQNYTDKNGNFTISYDNTAKVISFKKIGFKDFTVVVDPFKNYINVVLKKQNLKLQEIIITEVSGNIEHQKAANDIQTLTNYDFNPGDIHFENIISRIPNINFSGGTSRPRFFQIRGIGELSQYAGEGGPNYYVGTVIDNIDLSGIGMSLFLDDVTQIEVYQGPQSYAYGHNAMAGLINIKTKDPSEEFKKSLNLTFGNDDLTKISYYHQFKPLFKKQLFSNIFIFNSQQNGFKYNQFLNDYKNNKFEELQKIKLVYLPSANFSSKLTLLNSNLNNGYDAWSPNNNLDTTYSNEPGKDSQKLKAIAIENTLYFKPFSLIQISTYLDSDMKHSYDSDWGNDFFWSEDPYNVNYWSYEYFQNEFRRRYMSTHEFRLTKNLKNFIFALGYYYKDLKEKDNADGYILGGSDIALNSIFNLTNHAIFNEIKLILNNFTFSINTRFEQVNLRYQSKHFHVEYPNYDYYNPIYFDTYLNADYHENLKAGKFSINYEINSALNMYASISSGYKAGGINQNSFLSNKNRLFKPEQNTNIDIGFKYKVENFKLNFNSFYMKRENLQVSLSRQEEPDNPQSFNYYTSNASDGYNYGITMNFNHIYEDTFESYLNIGYLKTKINSFSYFVDTTNVETFYDREAAHAPSYSVSWGFNKYYKNISFGADLTSKDKFYYDVSHNEQSTPYTLVNLNVAYQINSDLNISVWANNIFNTSYTVRGFYFDNEPNDADDNGNYYDDNKLYLMYGEPFTIGANFNYKF